MSYMSSASALQQMLLLTRYTSALQQSVHLPQSPQQSLTEKLGKRFNGGEKSIFSVRILAARQ